MKVKFYGVRGSIPVCERGFQEFGGNTTCVLVWFNDDYLAILDAGSGIRNLGKDLIALGHAQYDNIFIGFSHFHWDHIQGFPFFAPAYDHNRHFTISAVGKDRHTTDLRTIFATQMQREYFPVPLEKMGARFTFHQITNDSFSHRNVLVRTMRHNHPGGAYSYRIEYENKTLVFSTDIEHGADINQDIVEFAKGADLLIHDAQYTPEELQHKRGWGHSSWEQAIEVAEQAGIQRLALTHHDPDHNDKFLFDIEKQCQQRLPDSFLAREKMIVEL